MQFEVETYKEIIIPTKEGIIAYLTSGQIKGIGPKTAEKIYAAFGNRTLDMLDSAPQNYSRSLVSVQTSSKNLRFLLGFPRRP